MTREKFLEELKAALSQMKEEEREGVLSYYSEMIDDRIEAGMTEEAAVQAMEPVREIASRVLEEAGMGESKPRDDEKGNWQQISRPAEAGKEIRIQAEGKRITVMGEEDRTDIQLRYCIGSADIFRLHEDDNALVLEHKLRPVSSFVNEKPDSGFSLDSILNFAGKLISSLGGRIVSGVNYEAAENEIEVLVPKSYSGALYVSTSNARVNLHDLTCGHPITLTTSNARILVNDVNCAQGVSCTTSNSRITLEDVNADIVRLITSNGRVELDDVYTRGKLDAANSNGGITASDTTAEGAIKLVTSNGRIEMKDSTAPDITLKTNNGAITGTIKGSREEYTVSSSTSNGSNQLGSFPGGEKRLSAVTSNGAITLGFSE